MDVQLFQKATGGHKEVPEDWVSGTGLRALIQGDAALLWLKYHGKANGFEEDPAEYSFLNWIGDKGRAFESAWIKKVAPDAVQALDEDVDVRRVQGLTRTLALMAKKVPVITKAALWWEPSKIYGSADLIVLTSWLYAKFPHLKPSADGEPDRYVVLDCKFTSKLETNDKKVDLACNSAQVRLYSYMLAKLQGYMPSHAYLVTRDRPFNLLPVAVDHRLDGPLDPVLADLRDLHTHIKFNGHQFTPWTHQIVCCNFMNSHDEPWHQAKKRIAEHLRPLEWLPHVGRSQVAELKQSGLTCLDHVLSMRPDSMNWEALHGIGKTTAPRIRAVLEANRSGKASEVPAALVPRRAAREYYVDYEFLSNLNVDFDHDFPAMAGCEMVFMVGIGWEERGKWNYRQFVAEQETSEAERKMFGQFLAFLDQVGALSPAVDAALYHWSNAEESQSRNAAARHGLPILGSLPWVDLQKPAHAIPLGLSGAWGYGLKEIAHALGQVSPGHRVDWPEGLADGLSASVMGWRMYEQPEPLQAPELGILSQYLEIDCKALWAVLSWMRAVAVEDAHWYKPADAAPTGKRGKKRSTPRKPRPKTTKKRTRRRASGEGWYRSFVGAMLDGVDETEMEPLESNTQVGPVLGHLRHLHFPVAPS